MSGATIDQSRRAFLFGAKGEPQADTALRPPWSLPDAFPDRCTGCGSCVTACPEEIVTLDEKNRAIVDFQRGAGLCSFCGACADVCPEPVFLTSAARAATPPWSLRVTIGAACLTHDGVMCQSCKDACGEDAIRFVYAAGCIPAPVVDLDRCTGCGGCVAPCPATAIEIQPTAGADA
jgi:ferredoxin-type protein NapF